MLIGCCLLGTAASAQPSEMLCWTDDDGRRICSDSFSPEDSRFDRDVLNQQGIKIREEQGEITDEERAAMDAVRLAQEAERQRRAEQAQYDKMLLDSFLTVADMETRRDRLLEQIDGQETVIELYLGNLQRKLESLNKQGERYAPRNTSEGAPPMPMNLELDIERTNSSIDKFEQRLNEIRAEQERVRLQFESDINRFRELTNGA